MKTLLTMSLLVVAGLGNVADAAHRNQANSYASAVHRDAHRMDVEIRHAFPLNRSIQRKSQQLAGLAHTTESLVLSRTHLDQAEHHIRVMRSLLRSLDADLHAIATNHPYQHGHNATRLLRRAHQLESYLTVLAREVRELNRFVILPHPHPGHGRYYGHPSTPIRRPVPVSPVGGIHVRGGGLVLNIPF